ncbi:hypothetical protein MF271_23715 (plasmid) [Deinococcus sp. KNUC1210]|uniref:hypothetical protein n=1 Tax=Deinococcus sp. KNUC1210 TaxID=2917691 RepID=UPI001EF02589|nr:hypothetical protein [Deinococcus sp. KNUC1210]ULH17972.1 hypothetical protein MF271_23715 [Deinococcus sp. KNUC1210]
MNPTTWRITAALFFLGGVIRAATAYHAWANGHAWLWNGLLAAGLLFASASSLLSSRAPT